jgi:DNA-binding CsgD family transcriptional regulator
MRSRTGAGTKPGVADALRRGRQAYVRRAWKDAFELLSLSDLTAPLGAEDLELLATSTYMLGRRDDLSALERAYQIYLDDGAPLRAAHCAGWVGMHLFMRGELGRATGWLGRAQRLVEREGRDCVERGYLLFPDMFQQEATGDYEAAAATAARAAETGERFGDADLFALATQSRGILLIRLGRVAEGLGLLDEAMVAVTAGELSPIVSGLVYCGVIRGCQDAFELRRAREWTAALTRWCEEQSDMVAFTGVCLVHRAEILQLQGSWADALTEAEQAAERCAQTLNPVANAEALYRQGEIRRLQGDVAAAEEAYRSASRLGWEPQPGLALLRLAEGNVGAADAAIRRVLAETVDRAARMRLLPSFIEIVLAVGDAQAAREASRELDELAGDYGSGVPGALVAQARGAVDLADGDATAALVALRHAWHTWQELGAPYEAARVRVLLGIACRALGDEEAAALELEAARGVFERLGAVPDLARLESASVHAEAPDTHGLTPRELEVLRLVAAGQTNRGIAAELVLSERTIERHVSNILAKLRVSSRAAATAYAYEHQLV